MNLFNVFRSRKQRNIEDYREKNEYMKLKQERMRIKNSIYTSKANADLKKMTKQLDKLETVADIKDYIEQMFPSQKNWILEALEKPEVQQIVMKFLGGQGDGSEGIKVSDREKKVHDIIKSLPPDVIQKGLNLLSEKK